MKLFASIILTLLFSASIFAQINNINSFVPKGYSILDTAFGDLNQDTYTDCLLILRNKLDTTDPSFARPLLILHGQKDASYKLIVRNDSVVLCQSCGGVFGDPYSDLVITNNYFSIELYGGSNWRWSRIITFKYNPLTKQYTLHKDAGNSYHISDPDTQEYHAYNQELWNKQLFKSYNAW